MCTVTSELIRYEIQGHVDRKETVDVYRLVRRLRPPAHSLGVSQWADAVAREAIKTGCCVLWEPREDLQNSTAITIARTAASKDESNYINDQAGAIKTIQMTYPRCYPPRHPGIAWELHQEANLKSS